ncbi:MAG: Ig-like domain repeat protein [Acidobacteriota bacterium]
MAAAMAQAAPTPVRLDFVVAAPPLEINAPLAVKVRATIIGTATLVNLGPVQLRVGGLLAASGATGAALELTYTFTPTVAGPLLLEASFAGDANYTAASASTTIQISKYDPEITIGCSTPADCNAKGTYGSSWVVSGYVQARSGTPFTQLAQFTIGGKLVHAWDANARVDYRVVYIPERAGPLELAAIYPGDANYNTRKLVWNVTIPKGLTQTILQETNQGGSAGILFLTATVNGGGAIKPTGRLTLTEAGSTIANAVLDVSGKTTFTIPNPAGVVRFFTVSYPGDANYDPSASPTLTVEPAKAETTCTLTGPAVGREGDVIPVNAAVAPKTPATGVAAPSGFMEIRSGAAVLTTLPAGNASNVQLNARPRGNESLVLAYAGDSNYSACASAPLAIRIDGTLAPFSAASALAKLAPGSIGSVYGTGFAQAITQAPALPLPTNLGGVTLELQAGTQTIPLPLFFTSPSQVNFHMPLTAPVGTGELVLRSVGSLWRSTVDVQQVAPALFSANGDGQGPAAALYLKRTAGVPDQTGLTFTCPAPAACTNTPLELGGEGDTLVVLLFGTGLRNAGGNRAVSALIGNAPAQVLYAGPQSETPGLDQVNAVVPRSLVGRGVVNVTVTVDGVASNPVQIAVR